MIIDCPRSLRGRTATKNWGKRGEIKMRIVTSVTPSASFMLAPALCMPRASPYDYHFLPHPLDKSKSFTASQLPSRARAHTYATLKIHKIASATVLWCNKESSTETGETLGPAVIFGLPRKDVAQPLFLLLLSQFILFVGVGAVIPTLPLYGKAIGLSSAVNGIVISAPAVALLIGARAAGEYAGMSFAPSGPRVSLLLSLLRTRSISRCVYITSARSQIAPANRQ